MHSHTNVQPTPIPEGALRINLTLPVTRITFGLFTIDPVAQFLGMPLTEVLSSLMVGPLYQRPSPGGVAVDVYPLALPLGEGTSIRLGQWGDIGFSNDGGYLRLIVPWAVVGWVQHRLAHCIVHGPVQSLSLDRTAYVAEVWIRLQPGMRASIPLATLGELGVEAG